MQEVLTALKELSKGIHESSSSRNVPNSIKLLIPHKFVPKLIGISNSAPIVEGNTLHEIKTLSGGAQITILSDREKEQVGDETVVVVEGEENEKSRAVAIIAEKIAAFRYTDKVGLGNS